MMDDGVHAIDTLRWMCGGEVVGVESRCRRIGVPDINWIGATLYFDNGSVGYLLNSWVSGRRVFRVEMHAPGIAVDAEVEGAAWVYADGDYEGKRFDAKEVAGSDELFVYGGFQAKHREFIDVLRGRAERTELAVQRHGEDDGGGRDDPGPGAPSRAASPVDAAGRRGRLKGGSSSGNSWPVARIRCRPRTTTTRAGRSAKRSATLVLELRRRRLATDEQGRRVWVEEAPMERVQASAAAVLVCDMWDRHWSSGRLSSRRAARARASTPSADGCVVPVPSSCTRHRTRWRPTRRPRRVPASPGTALSLPPRVIELPPLPVACYRRRF